MVFADFPMMSNNRRGFTRYFFDVFFAPGTTRTVSVMKHS